MKRENSDITIMVVARQAGTAHAFASLIEEFGKTGITVRTYAFLQAHTVFGSHGIDSLLIDRFEDFAGINTQAPSLLLTGTSECAAKDNLFWEWARDRCVPTLAFVDSWVSYWQRFSDTSKGPQKFNCTPGLIGVIDRFMYDRMIENGCPEDLLVITGNPAFDRLHGYVSAQRQGIRSAYGDHYILFIGEPHNRDLFGDDEKAVRGYTEAEVLELTAKALDSMQGLGGVLLYRPHPRGCSAEVASIITQRRDIIMDTCDFDTRDMVSCASGIVGMTSMPLFEASIMGVPAISIQPNKKTSFDIIDHCSKIPIVTSPELPAVCRAIQNAFSSAPMGRNLAKSTLYDVIRSIVSCEAVDARNTV